MKKIASFLIILMAFLLFSSKAYAGAFDLSLSNGNTTLNCQRGDSNCVFQTVVIAKNRTDKPLYNTTMYTSAPSNSMTYIGFDGSWTSGQSRASKIVQPGEEIVNTLVKAVYPSNFTGPIYAAFYIDAQTCNPNTTPPDCVYYGASSFTVTINIVDPTPTATPRVTNTPVPTPSPTRTNTPTPRPTNTPTSTPRVTPTPGRTVTPTPRVTATPISANRNQNQNQNNNNNGNSNSSNNQNNGNNNNNQSDNKKEDPKPNDNNRKDNIRKITKKTNNITSILELIKPIKDNTPKATNSAKIKNKEVNNRSLLSRILSFFHFK